MYNRSPEFPAMMPFTFPADVQQDQVPGLNNLFQLTTNPGKYSIKIIIHLVELTFSWNYYRFRL